MSPFVGWAIAAYFIGSIPVGLLIGRARGVDIRTLGSGNIGATNVGRVLGRKFGAMCFLLDLLKGLTPTLCAGIFTGSAGRLDLAPGQVCAWLGVALAAVLGHVFPVWLKFKGGKGVATGFGVLLGAFPVLTGAAIGAALVWTVSAKISKYVGLSSCLAAISLPIFVWMMGPMMRATGMAAPDQHVPWPYLAAALAMAALVFWTHRGNLARTFAGTERRIGSGLTNEPGAGTSAR